ncbi:MAG: hypothetical protein CO029_01285 [Candidatus Magasanikbacteria bacterium CG_4_9_14_0_2_um_filter_41_10]|uniref:Uncharacterized protein n=1 Tax=Candidatus Magasanikbacteria bacterium CG_4_10_14_0_2_um_filter_41_31 TaxID=1974639 RepID=A0A2M7V593_9BACT|nr:MAG: hypothetical protein AUJ37_01895 [Candidatus Magasanikbacteria bacterium CG1_02_41_34]PIZ93725.1 MAG: hypothetical protein COX83_01155 [Candidatus Magasanikbacteria bacterium CG_4_10_14_0_2_um_filter_41_31]PJC53713.1 MAG: hypothetical protein CO029_01285 [Candidatus Magasanikbacteria bacterium CG_4_9_14_0_2_um_filter_41_10]
MKNNRSISTYSLIVVNLIPLFGVLFLSWSLIEILFLFWAETAVIGFFTFWKIFLSKKIDPEELTTAKKLPNTHIQPGRAIKIVLLFFFPFHFGMFMLGHFIFLIIVFVEHGPFQTLGENLGKGILFSFVSLFISHLISFLVNYIGKKEYEQYSPQELMIQPYKRVVIMHVTILLGGIVISALGAPVFALVMLVLMKILLDLFAHTKEHSNKQTQPQI